MVCKDRSEYVVEVCLLVEGKTKCFAGLVPERAPTVKDSASRTPFDTRQVPGWCAGPSRGYAGGGGSEWVAGVRLWDEVPV